MSTTTVKMQVNLLEKSVTYMANTLLQMGYRIEHGRGVQGGYMSRNHEIIERGLRTWLTEQKLKAVHFEILDAKGQEAFERFETELEYMADAREELTKPPIEKLENLFRTLRQLPKGANFRIAVSLVPDASEVPGWVSTSLRPFKGGVAQETDLGAHGFGFIFGKTRYLSGTSEYRA